MRFVFLLLNTHMEIYQWSNRCSQNHTPHYTGYYKHAACIFQYPLVNGTHLRMFVCFLHSVIVSMYLPEERTSTTILTKNVTRMSRTYIIVVFIHTKWQRKVGVSR